MTKEVGWGAKSDLLPVRRLSLIAMQAGDDCETCPKSALLCRERYGAIAMQAGDDRGYAKPGNPVRLQPPNRTYTHRPIHFVQKAATDSNEWRPSPNSAGTACNLSTLVIPRS